MEEIYDDSGRNTDHLNLIQYYALYDPNGEQGLIQGLRYYPRNVSTVIPNNPKLDTKINYYKPYTNPRVVLPKPRYAKKLTGSNNLKTSVNKNSLNTLNQQDYLNQYNNNNGNTNKFNDDTNFNQGESNNINSINQNDDVYKTYRRSYSNDKNDFLIEKN